VGLTPAQLAPTARTIVRAAVSAVAADPEAQVRAIARTAVPTLAELLFARSTAQPAGGVAAGVVRELRAFQAALDATTIA
jgi:hypothetical protein